MKSLPISLRPLLAILAFLIFLLGSFGAMAAPANQNFDGVPLGSKLTQSYLLSGVIYSTNDSGGLPISIVDDGNIASGGDKALAFRSTNVGTTTRVGFRSNDGSEFKLNTFVLSTGLGDQTVTVRGYRDDVEQTTLYVTTATFAIVNVSADSAWQWIDEVRITGNDLDIDIDDISFSAAVPPTFSITYNGNANTGGSVPTDGSSPYVSGDTVTVLGNTGALVRTGYTFAGWNTAADGSGTSYSPTDTFAIGTSNVTLYAQWTAVNYTVTYNGNTNTGGSVPTDGNTYHITDTVTVLGNTGTLVKTGYTFAGWNTAANGSGTSYSAGNTFAMGSNNVTLYAQWTENTYSVTYNGNSNTGGAVPTDATAYHNGDTATVLGNTGSLVRAGYTFAGWNTAANGSGTSYTGGDTFAIGTSNVTLYAQWALTSYMVINTNDSGPGSLRDAVASVTAGGTIAFDAGLNGQSIILQSELTINKNLTINGNGVSNTIIDGNNAARLFNVAGAYTVSWADMTLTKGSADNGGCIYGNAGSALTLTRVTANQCFASNTGGALWGNIISLTESTISNSTAAIAGGIFGGVVTVVSSTLSGNAATTGQGGAIAMQAPMSLNVTNSTIVGNQATLRGGGIDLGTSIGIATIRHSTITANATTGSGGGIYSVPSNILIEHSILAGNTAASYPDALGYFTSIGYNRIGTVDNIFISAAGDSTGVAVGSLSLGTLADNGGPTKTIAIGADSVARDAGATNCSATAATDQRGVTRPQGSACDIGAYEGFNTAPTFGGSTTTLTVGQSASATDIKDLLHVSDVDSGQTLTWTLSSAPSHGTLGFSSATASSGSTDITPGGTITYTPTAGYVGSDSFTVQVSDGSHSATRTISVTISAPTVTVADLTLNSMVAATTFVSQSFSASGGHGSYTYDVSAGALPAGLNLSTAGLLSGTPTTAGAFSFTVQATDSSTGAGAPFSGTRAFSGTVAPTPVPGACGSSHGGTFTSVPATNLCGDSSVPTVTAGNTNYTWICAGSHGGTPASCLATRNYTVTTSAGANGSISASQTVAHLATPSFTVTPKAGYTASVGGTCGGNLVGTTYTTSPVTANCTVTASFQTATATQTNIPTRATGVTASMVVSGCSVINGPAFIDAPSGASNGTSFPFGLLGFTLTGCATGGTATVTVTYSQTLPASATFFKYLNGNYAAYTAALDANTNSVTFTLTDGGAGDADGATNGSITDPGGIGVQAVPTSPQTIPTLSEWGMILMSSLLALFGLVQMRRRGAL